MPISKILVKIIYITSLFWANYATAKNSEVTGNIANKSTHQQSASMTDKLSPTTKNLLEQISLIDQQKFSEKFLVIISKGEVEKILLN